MIIKTLKKAGLGFVLGMAVGNVIAAITTSFSEIVAPALLDKSGSLAMALMLQTLLSGVIGAVAFAGISFYDIERWPLIMADLVHYISIIVVFIPTGFFLGWLENATDVIIIASIMLLVHLIIFMIMCAIYRAEIREMNRLTEERRKRTETGGAL